jgi:formamidopyrimidine-DNA glycosylase
MLEPAMLGARFRRVIVNRPNLRIPFPARFAERLRGQSVKSVSRRGKYLAVSLSSGETLIIHLGMSGWFHVAAIGDRSREADPHDHVAFVMSSGQTVLFNDPRRFGLMDLSERGQFDQYPALSVMGPEPLSPEFDGAALARACKGKKTSLKVALLDQRVVAGIGNIYASEALHRARLSPRRRASTIATRTGAPLDSAVRLAGAIKAVLIDAIERGGSYATTGGPRFRVYEREGERCLTRGCRGTIKRITQMGRSTFFCSVCQK